MPSPPKYADLGKSVKDLFEKGYNYGTVKLDVKTKTKDDVDFNTTYEHNNDVQKSLGTLEAKIKCPQRGLTYVEKWNTDNILKSELTFEDKLAKGLKLAIETTYSPSTGKKSGLLKSTYSNDKWNVNTDVDLGNAMVHNATTLSYLNWVLGLQSSLYLGKLKLTRTNAALAYIGKDFSVHSSINNGAEFSASVYQRLNPKTELGVSVLWTSVNNQTRFAIATKYELDKLASVHAKVNNLSQIGFSYTQQLSDGTTFKSLKLILSALIDGRNINAGGHKLGLGLEFEA